MSRRTDLDAKLRELLGSTNVYYQPPESIKMKYPAIKYSRTDIRGTYANNSTYLQNDCYELIVIDPKPDNPVIKELLRLPSCRFNRHYTADNLNHDVLTIFY